MEGLSVAANSIAVVSVAFQLIEACTKLYNFWESVQDAPQEILTIKEDLTYLISVFTTIETNGQSSNRQCVAEGVYHCRAKVAELMLIVDKFELGFQSSSRKKRVRTAFRAAIHSKHVQRFRDSLNETKATLTLALVHESLVQARAGTSPMSVNIANGLHHRSLTGKTCQMVAVGDMPIRDKRRQQTFKLDCYTCNNEVPSVDALMNLMRPVDAECMPKFHVQHLMLHAVAQTAVATFQSTSLDILAQDGYVVDDCGQPRAKTFVYAESRRYSIRHHASNFWIASGHAWVRTTTIYPTKDSDGDTTSGNSQTVTSFVFYPRAWLKYLGFQRGLEAIVSSAGQGWLLNCRITLTRAIPEDSLIFDLCRTGQTRAVELLFEKRLASVVDTSPKGWKPLHFAAAAGHVDLCNMLIRAGADKSALVYEGPSESILSPISIFVACSPETHAETKIRMLRMFHDCIDLASPESDGWQVHDWLKRAYAREKVPISRNSITWLLHLTANERYVECSPRIIWSALQHAVRSVLNHECYSRHLARIFQLSNKKAGTLSQQRLSTLSSWVALRVVGRVLLPMVLHVGAFLQMKGFDWIEDYMSYRQFLQAQPNLYAAWCHAVLDAVEKIEDYLREELDLYMQQLSWSLDDLRGVLSEDNASYCSDDQMRHLQTCSRCQHDYGSMAHSLVEPARIAIQECINTGHDSNCRCRNISQERNVVAEPTEYTGVWCEDSEEDDSDTNADFFDAQPFFFDAPSPQNQINGNMFSEIATLLYKAQGRVWIGSYTINERLCGVCFLLKEQYIGEDGFAAEFPPMPESFKSLRTRW